MTIRFTCPDCNQAYSLPDETAGKSARCKKCGRTLQIPAPGGETEDGLADYLAEYLDDQPASAAPQTIASPSSTSRQAPSAGFDARPPLPKRRWFRSKGPKQRTGPRRIPMEFWGLIAAVAIFALSAPLVEYGLTTGRFLAILGEIFLYVAYVILSIALMRTPVGKALLLLALLGNLTLVGLAAFSGGLRLRDTPGLLLGELILIGPSLLFYFLFAHNREQFTLRTILAGVRQLGYGAVLFLIVYYGFPHDRPFHKVPRPKEPEIAKPELQPDVMARPQTPAERARVPESRRRRRASSGWTAEPPNRGNASTKPPAEVADSRVQARQTPSDRTPSRPTPANGTLTSTGARPDAGESTKPSNPAPATPRTETQTSPATPPDATGTPSEPVKLDKNLAGVSAIWVTSGWDKANTDAIPKDIRGVCRAWRTRDAKGAAYAGLAVGPKAGSLYTDEARAFGNAHRERFTKFCRAQGYDKPPRNRDSGAREVDVFLVDGDKAIGVRLRVADDHIVALWYTGTSRGWMRTDGLLDSIEALD